MTPTPCPCPRPEGLSDEEVREKLAQGRLHLPWAYTFLRRGAPESEAVNWHVIEWTRCRSRFGNQQCHLADGHDGRHSGEPERGMASLSWAESACTAGADSRTWVVPCWTRTAAEAERWRGEGERASDRCAVCVVCAQAMAPPPHHVCSVCARSGIRASSEAMAIAGHPTGRELRRMYLEQRDRFAPRPIPAGQCAADCCELESCYLAAEHSGDCECGICGHRAASATPHPPWAGGTQPATCGGTCSTRWACTRGCDRDEGHVGPCWCGRSECPSPDMVEIAARARTLAGPLTVTPDGFAAASPTARLDQGGEHCRFDCALCGSSRCVRPSDDHVCHRCETCPPPDPRSPAALLDADIRAGLVTADEVRAARGLPPAPSQAAGRADTFWAIGDWAMVDGQGPFRLTNIVDGRLHLHMPDRDITMFGSHFRGGVFAFEAAQCVRAVELRVTLTDRPLIEARIEGRRAPDDVQAAVSFIGWARGWARWTPPPPKPSTLFDAARGWLARRRAAWLASEAERVAAIRDAERTSRLRRAGREAAELNRALAEGRLGLVAGGLPVDD